MSRLEKKEKLHLTALFCYLLGPVPLLGQISCLVILLFSRKNKFVSFHAKQSLIFFTLTHIISLILSLSLIGLIIAPFFLITIFVLWLLFLWKTLNAEAYRFPIIGSIAKKIKV